MKALSGLTFGLALLTLVPADAMHDRRLRSALALTRAPTSRRIVPRSVELCEASAAVNDVKRPSRFEQQGDCLFPFLVSSKRGS